MDPDDDVTFDDFKSLSRTHRGLLRPFYVAQYRMRKEIVGVWYWYLKSLVVVSDGSLLAFEHFCKSIPVKDEKFEALTIRPQKRVKKLAPAIIIGGGGGKGSSNGVGGSGVVGTGGTGSVGAAPTSGGEIKSRPSRAKMVKINDTATTTSTTTTGTTVSGGTKTPRRGGGATGGAGADSSNNNQQPSPVMLSVSRSASSNILLTSDDPTELLAATKKPLAAMRKMQTELSVGKLSTTAPASGSATASGKQQLLQQQQQQQQQQASQSPRSKTPRTLLFESLPSTSNKHLSSRNIWPQPKEAVAEGISAGGNYDTSTSTNPQKQPIKNRYLAETEVRNNQYDVGVTPTSGANTARGKGGGATGTDATMTEEESKLSALQREAKVIAENNELMEKTKEVLQPFFEKLHRLNEEEKRGVYDRVSVLVAVHGSPTYKEAEKFASDEVGFGKAKADFAEYMRKGAFVVCLCFCVFARMSTVPLIHTEHI
jgi:hypothetical protein